MKQSLSVTNKFFRPFLMICLAFALCLTACDKDDDPVDPGDDEELITTLTITLTNPSNETVSFSFRDLDGDGGNDATVETIKLSANTTYTASIEVLNESESPAEDITAEIKEEDEDHLFIFSPTSANLTVTITDVDANNDPVGLLSSVVSGEASTGSLGISLKHQSDKSNPLTTGETDIEVTFPVEIQ